VKSLIAVVGVGAAVTAGAAFGASAWNQPEPASAAVDKAVVRQLRALRSEMRRSTAELRALNDAVGRPSTASGSPKDVLHELREICRTSEITAQGIGLDDISAEC
jgi:hypothetical protein